MREIVYGGGIRDFQLADLNWWLRSHLLAGGIGDICMFFASCGNTGQE